MSYTGPLMELRRINSSTFDMLPLEWISATSYKTTPSQRLDTSDSKRNLLGDLSRTVLQHRKTKIEFELRPMTNVEIAQFNTFMRNHYTVEAKREFVCRYYNEETDDYLTGTFYMPNPQYTIGTVDYHNKVIKYKSTRISFIEN